MGNIELLINGLLVDVGNDFKPAFTFSVGDYSNPFDRGVSFSYQTLVPFTKRNNNIFNHLYDFAVSITEETPYNHQPFRLPFETVLSAKFNRNKLNTAIIKIGGVIVFQGLVSLVSIQYGYELLFKSGDSDYLGMFQERKISEIEWTDEYCHNVATVTNWDKDGLVDKFVFPLIDYGNVSDAEYANGFFDVTDFYPAVFTWQILKQMFLDAGYTLESSFFSANKNLIIPFTNETLLPKDETLLEDVDMLELLADDIFLDNTFQTVQVGGGTEVINVLGQWDGGTSAFTMENTDGICDTNKPMIYEVLCTCDAKKMEAFAYPLGFEVKVNGSSVYTEYVSLDDSGYYPLVFRTDIEIVEGDYIEVFFGGGSSVTSFDIKNIKLYITRLALESDNMEGVVFLVREQLPDMQQVDFLRAVMQIFNLYLKMDYNAKKVYLEPIDKRLLDPALNAVDWTNKIDWRNRQITFRQDDFSKIERLTYTSDSDVLNEAYQTNNQDKVYGFYEWQNTSVNATGENELQTEFSPTQARDRVFLVYAETVIVGLLTIDYNYYAILPTIWTKDPFLADPPEFELKTGWNPRILYYEYEDAIYAQDNGFNARYYLNVQSNYGNTLVAYVGFPKSWFYHPPFPSTLEQSTAYQAITYPQPTKELRFGDYLYDNYHAKQFSKINEQRIVTMYANLNASDIQSLDFFKPIKIGNFFFYLQTVDSYVPNGTDPIKITLLQIV